MIGSGDLGSNGITVIIGIGDEETHAPNARRYLVPCCWRAPWLIIDAPYESTMGLVQKIFYFHIPSASLFLIAAIVCGVQSAIFLFGKKASSDAVGARGRGAGGGVRDDHARDRAALGAEGLGRVVGVGRAAHLEPAPVDDLRAPICCCAAYGGPGSDKLGAGMALFGMANVPFIYRLGQRVADAPPA